MRSEMSEEEDIEEKEDEGRYNNEAPCPNFDIKKEERWTKLPEVAKK